MNLSAIAAAVSAVIAGSAGFALAWNIQAKILLDTKLEHSDAVIVQQRNARAAIERATGAVIAAQNEARVRDGVIRRDAAAAASSGVGLRLASTTAVRSSTADIETCSATVAAYGVVVDESISFIREVAGVADQCVSDNKALTDSWVK